MNSHNAKNPTGGASVRRVVEPSDPNDHLLERILERSSMQAAWKRVKANQGAAGVDNMAIDKFASVARNRWPKPIKPTFWASPSQVVKSAGQIKPWLSLNAG